MKTPSALKWMAETRARLAYELSVYEELVRTSQATATKLAHDLAALDRTIQVFDGKLDPTLIDPIHGFKGRYGKRGALKDCILDTLQEAASTWTDTLTLEVIVCARLNLTFETPTRRLRWYNSTFSRQLRLFASEGVIEREHDPDNRAGHLGRWRWAQESHGTLASLARD